MYKNFRNFGEQAISIMVDYKNDKNGIYTYINSGKEQSKNLESFINSVVKLNFGELILNSR